MTHLLLLSALVILACVLCNKLSSKLGVPTLLAFILLGMFFGSDGVVKIPFDNYGLAQNICSFALIFIMFYGGFGTNWSQAKPVAGKAAILSSFGTAFTAGLVGLFCWAVLSLPTLESFLLGAVIASTDAASVFSILRSKRLNLRDHTASLLEVESGSNDPFSYMLTLILLTLMTGEISAPAVVYQIFAQLVYGGALGVGVALAARAFLRRFRFASEGFDAIFLVAVALLSYVVPTLLEGNGYLSVYITGILLGNSQLENKKALVNFFDGATGLMQMLLFFLLGLLSFPSQLPAIAPTALAVVLFLTFVARPAVVFLLMAPFRSSPRQTALVAWSGMRGAASIVFSILAITSPAVTNLDLYHIVFFIVLFSILVQGTLIPVVAKKLNMTDQEANVLKTFTDYTDDVPVQFLQCTLPPDHPWAGQALRTLSLPPDCLLVLLLRRGQQWVPHGSTVLEPGDTLILSGRAGGAIQGVRLYERTLETGDPWLDRPLSTLSTGTRLIILVRRGGDVLIPKGDTVLLAGDTLVINDSGVLPPEP